MVPEVIVLYDVFGFSSKRNAYRHPAKHLRVSMPLSVIQATSDIPGEVSSATTAPNPRPRIYSARYGSATRRHAAVAIDATLMSRCHHVPPAEIPVVRTYPFNLPNPGVRDIVRTYIPEKSKLTEGLICRSSWPNPPRTAVLTVTNRLAILKLLGKSILKYGNSGNVNAGNLNAENSNAGNFINPKPKTQTQNPKSKPYSPNASTCTLKSQRVCRYSTYPKVPTQARIVRRYVP